MFKLGCDPTAECPIYSMDWSSVKVVFEEQLGYHFKVKVTQAVSNCFQDGSPICAGLKSFHGTREIALKSVLTNGLKSSAEISFTRTKHGAIPSLVPIIFCFVVFLFWFFLLSPGRFYPVAIFVDFIQGGFCYPVPRTCFVDFSTGRFVFPEGSVRF